MIARTVRRVGSILLLAVRSNEPRQRRNARTCIRRRDEPPKRRDRGCKLDPNKLASPVQESPNVATATVRQADDASKDVAVSVTARRRASVPDCHENLSTCCTPARCAQQPSRRLLFACCHAGDLNAGYAPRGVKPPRVVARSKQPSAAVSAEPCYKTPRS